MHIKTQQLELEVGKDQFTIYFEGTKWCSSFHYFVLADGTEIYFKEAKQITQILYQSGVGNGICTRYEAFANADVSFETLIWVEESTQDIYFEWIPLKEETAISKVYFPAFMEFDERKEEHYSLVNYHQGLLIPNSWETPLQQLPFDGMLNSCAAYMPWFAQVKDKIGYIAIHLSPSDGGYTIDHPQNGPYTHLGMYHLARFDHMEYRRVVRFTFVKEADPTRVCKVYRQYAKEIGLLTTLKEKATRNPLVDKLIGAAFVHKGIKTHICEDSEFYDAENPKKNDTLIPFSIREQEIHNYYKKGINKLYLHLDGWAQPGYDNQHPDYLPACIEAGGWEGLKALSDTIKNCHYMLGLHDQYRDYYFSAKTFDKDFALTHRDGSIFEMSRWAGGHQSYLCASQAAYYVKRNFKEILSHGIHLEASYLDVFTCNEADQCYHPWHKMDRAECLRYRNACFDYLQSIHILPSSEEASDYAMRSLVFCHYAPYQFMMSAPEAPHLGIPVPLFNLVYHDCLIIPWYMDEPEGKEDYMLYALLNGGAAYLDKDGAYPNIDGAFFDESYQQALDHKIARYHVVSTLQEKVAKEEMVRHEFIDRCWYKQRSYFANGITVEVDLKENHYQITYPE